MRRLVVGSVAALLCAAPAGAGTIVVGLGLTPGKLAVVSTPTHLAAGSSASIPVKVADARGSGKGWTLRFAGGTGLQVTSITARCAGGSTCTLPSAAGPPAGAVVLQALRDTGMGVISLVVSVRASAGSTVVFSVS